MHNLTSAALGLVLPARSPGSSEPRRAKVLSAALGVTLPLTLLGGCGHGDAAADAESGRTTETPATGSGQPSADPSDEVVDVEPADGPRLEFSDFTVRLPKGYTVADQLVEDIWQANREDQPPGIDQVTITDFPASYHSYDESIRSLLRTTHLTLKHVKRLPDVEIDGETGFHAQADIVGGLTDGAVYEIVLLTLPKGPGDRTGVGVSAVWTMPSSRPAAKRLELLQSVLATWQWR